MAEKGDSALPGRTLYFRVHHHGDSPFASAAEIPYDQLQSTPILDIAARLWEPERYACFRVCYASMRLLDDLVDDARETYRDDLSRVAASLAEQLQAGLRALRAASDDNALVAQLVAARKQFAIPFWPWERLALAMTYDLTHNGFSGFHQFLTYCEGAAIAPAAIFMHLCGVRTGGLDIVPPHYDIRAQARHLALFAYLTHIARDLFVDHRRGLNYFSDDLLKEYQFDRHTISDAIAAIGRQPQDTRDRLTGLLSRWLGLAARYRTRARAHLDQLTPTLEIRYAASLELVYGLYNQQFEQLRSNFTSLDESVCGVPSDQLKEQVQRLLSRFEPVRAKE